jgi:GNAT superfamily N-acetyltransferase
MTTSENDFYQAEHFFFKNISQNLLILEQSVATAYYTGVHSQDLNIVIQRGPLQNPHESIQKACQFFKLHQVPWTWLVKENLCDATFTKACEKAHLHFTGEVTAMGYSLNSEHALISDSRLKIIECTDDLNAWAIPLIAFDSTPETLQQYIKAHTLSPESFHHYVGLLDSQPITALTLSLHKGLARIDDVGTLPSHQRKGYGTEIMRHALAKAQQLGANTCFLGASSMGLQMYQKIGFSPLFNIRVLSQTSAL